MYGNVKKGNIGQVKQNRINQGKQKTSILAKCSDWHSNRRYAIVQGRHNQVGELKDDVAKKIINVLELQVALLVNFPYFGISVVLYHLREYNLE